MSQKYSTQTLLSLKEGDVVYINAFVEGLGRSKMVISECFEDCITGDVAFEGYEEDSEYGELYKEDFKEIYLVVHENMV